MRVFVIFALLAASVAAVPVAAPFDSVDFSKVLPRQSNTRVPIAASPRSAIEGRITNGEPAVAKQFPYQAGLLLGYSNGNFWCGGSVISDEWILTAAHCTDGVIIIRVTLGTLSTGTTGAENEMVFEVVASKETVFVHEDYDDMYLVNDVSLIRLPERVTFTDYVKPVQLPVFVGTAPRYTGEVAIASGWGKVSDASGTISPTLQWTDVPVITNAKCSTYYGRLETSHLCIGTSESYKSTCNGDSGGPLVLEGTDILVGVTSFGVTLGCEVGWPAGFSRVTSFLPWIEKISGVTPQA